MFDQIVNNVVQAPILFFAMGLLAILVKSDLRIPSEIAKFLSIYLLFDIGIRGGQELSHQGIDITGFQVMGVCVLVSLISPPLFFLILRKKLDLYNAGAIAATYGSISLVTFAAAITYIDNFSVPYGGYMVAGMAFMEAVSIVSGLMLIRFFDGDKTNNSVWDILKESLTSGSVYLLLGSLVIGFLTAKTGAKALEPFVYDIFKGMLCLYMLDMGLYTAQRMSALKGSAKFLISMAFVFPIMSAITTITICYFMKFSLGDSFLLTILAASASYIAVPAAMRMSVPQANIGMIIPLTLGITFPFNIVIGIPIYYSIMERIWQ